MLTEISDIEDVIDEEKTANEVNARGLKIILVTNIPTEKDYERVVFTFGTIANEDLKLKLKPDQLPFFSYEIQYDESELSGLTYGDVVKTFFDKKEFLKRLGTSTEKLGKPPIISDSESKAEQKKLEDYDKKRSNIISHNVMLTLKYLLPTRFPVVNNHFSSYDLFRGRDRLNTLFYNPFSTRNYVYLRGRSGIFTLKKVVWLNDFLNHPEYKKLISKGFSTNRKLKDALIKIKKDDIPERSTFLKLMKLCYQSSCKEPHSNFLDVGINESNDTTGENPEIFVDVELFEEQLKPDKESEVKCPYFGDYLGEELSRLMKETDPKKKPLNGKITKMPLFSLKTLTSRKLGEVEKTTEIVDEKEKERIDRENRKYDQEDDELRQEYEKNIDRFFKSLEKRSGLKNDIARLKITKKTFYFFLEDYFKDMFRSIADTSYKGKFIRTPALLTQIENRLNEVKSERKNFKEITIDELNRHKVMSKMLGVLIEEELEYLKDKPVTEGNYFKHGTFQDEKGKTGGYSIKKRRNIKRRTRKHRRRNN
jgi:hypothetical protein